MAEILGLVCRVVRWRVGRCTNRETLSLSGKVADLVMVKGNPLDNIDVLLNQETICLVMQGGKIVKGDIF